MLRVFISSTIRDLSYVRSTLADKIETQLKHDVVASESINFNWGREDIIESCISEVENSHVYILIIGKTTGSQIEGEGLSITQAEYFAAKASNKPIYIVIEDTTWTLFHSSRDSINTSLADFIETVSSDFARNVRPFRNSEEAFEYIQAQLSRLLEDYINTEYLPSEIENIRSEAEKSKSDLRFMQSLVLYSEHHNIEYDRILAILMQELKTGIINTYDFIPQPLVKLSLPRASTLYRLSQDGQTLERVGAAGDVGFRKDFELNDPNSFVSSAYKSKEVLLIDTEEKGKELEYIMCIPLNQRYVLTFHFLEERKYRKKFDEGIIVNRILDKNDIILSYLNFYLERG